MAGAVRFQLTEQDIVAAYRVSVRDRLGGSPAARITKQFSAAILVLLLVIWVASLIMSEQPIDATSLTGFLPITIGILGFIWLMHGLAYLNAARAARQMFHQRATFKRPVSFGWSVEGLSYESDHGSGRIPWSDLHRWLPADHAYLFYMDEHLFYFIPRSALSEAEAKDLEATVTASGLSGPARLEDQLIYA